MPKYTFSFVWRGMEDGGEGSSVLWPMCGQRLEVSPLLYQMVPGYSDWV